MRSSLLCVGASLSLYATPSRGFLPPRRPTLTPTRAAAAALATKHPASRSGARSRDVRSGELCMSLGLRDGDVFWAKELRHGMEYKRLGKSDLVVSQVCLGTMTWGSQNSDQEAFEQCDMAFHEFGVNFIDAAEMYPVPPSAETQGRTEIALGKWLKTVPRHNVIVATKVAGRSDRVTWLRDDGKGTRVNRKNIIEAVDKSLKRLDTDYIDLLQIHWPDRAVPLFGSNERYDVAKEHDDDTSFEEQLETMDELQRAGKIRAIGTSNDTPYGITKMAQLGERLGYPRVASVQNNYNMLSRADVELSSMPETCSRANADVSYLAYSPLAGGVLSGKYLDPDVPVPEARLNKFPGFYSRYRTPECNESTARFAKIAAQIGITPSQMALAWVYSREFITSTIVGATNIDTLRENLHALNCEVTEKAHTEILKVYEEFRDPTKTKREELPKFVFNSSKLSRLDRN
ncbi:unnamed protein product [Pylaiella littoralis]